MATKKQRLRRKTDSGYDIIHLETSADLVEDFDLAADARVADKVFAAGSASKGVYVGSDGKVAAMTYSVNKDVPADAKFTDTTYTAASATPNMDGVGTVGTSVKYAREDHTHPTDTTRASAEKLENVTAHVLDLEKHADFVDNVIQSTLEMHLTAEGNPASFPDAAAADIKTLCVTLMPTQSGSGNPSTTNVRPITGVSSVRIMRHNVPSGTLAITPIQSGSGDPSPTNVRPITPGLSFIRDDNSTLNVYGGTLDVTTGTLSVTYESFTLTGTTGVYRYANWDSSTHYGYYTGWFDDIENSSTSQCLSDKASFGYPGSEALYIYIAAGNGRCEIRIRKDLLAEGTNTAISAWFAENPVQLVAPLETPVTYTLTPTETDRALAALGYDMQSVTVQLVDSSNNPLTVYGGTLDVTTGTLTVTHKSITLTGYLYHWNGYDTGGHYCFYTGLMDDAKFNSSSEMISDKAVPGWGTAGSDISVYISRGTNGLAQIFFSKNLLPDYSDSTVNTWLANNPLQVVYPLRTPVTYQLTPQQFDTRAGYNEFWASGNSHVSVTYRADPTLAYNNLRSTFTNTILSLGAGI